MRRARLAERKRFAKQVADADAAGKPVLAPRPAPVLRPTENMLLLARENVATRLVGEGVLHPLDALALTVWPTGRIRDVEAGISYGTLSSRAFATRSNP